MRESRGLSQNGVTTRPRSIATLPASQPFPGSQHEVVKHKDYDRCHQCYKNVVEIKVTHARIDEVREPKSSTKRSHRAQCNINHRAFAIRAYDLAGDIASD